MEAKLSDDSPSSSFKHFTAYFPNVPRIQLVGVLPREKEFDWGLKIIRADSWLSQFSFSTL